jgi:hypothetical protein
VRYCYQSYQQRNVRHDDSAILVDRELWYKLQDLVVLKGNSSVFMEFDVYFFHIFSGNKTRSDAQLIALLPDNTSCSNILFRCFNVSGREIYQ